jgi:hypothetical protein
MDAAGSSQVKELNEFEQQPMPRMGMLARFATANYFLIILFSFYKCSTFRSKKNTSGTVRVLNLCQVK